MPIKDPLKKKALKYLPKLRAKYKRNGWGVEEVQRALKGSARVEVRVALRMLQKEFE